MLKLLELLRQLNANFPSNQNVFLFLDYLTFAIQRDKQISRRINRSQVRREVESGELDSKGRQKEFKSTAKITNSRKEELRKY